MTIYNFGSINIDYIYNVERLPTAGETLAASSFNSGLGGKGANQSVAIARASGDVRHIGAVGGDGAFAMSYLQSAGVDTSGIVRLNTPTGHAVINVDNAGENQIVIFPGANRELRPEHVEHGLANAHADDWLVMQNETSCQIEAAKIANAKGMRVAYSAAPFDAEAVRDILPYIHLLILNDVEAEQLSDALKVSIDAIPVPQVLVTRGRNGADWIDRSRATPISVSAFPVTPVDTTGAGDTFAGYALAGFDGGLDPNIALRRASAAAALQVQKKGTADAIPLLQDVLDFLG